MPLLTYHDLVDDLLDSIGGSGDNRNLKQCKRAVIEGLLDITQRRQWSYLTKRHRIVTDAPYSTGTIAYDFTGHASGERIVTLTTGTWPAWAARGVLWISNVPYEVRTRISDSLIQLEEYSNPGADVAASTSYTLVRDTYTLPADFSSCGNIAELEEGWGMVYVPANEWVMAGVAGDITNQPRQFSFIGDPDRDLTGRIALALWPAPDAQYNLDFIYLRTLTAPALYEYSTGTVAVTADSKTVTLTSGTWPLGVADQVFRISDSTTEKPTGLDGLQPYAEEHVIDTRDSDSQITLRTAITTTRSGYTYRVSSLLDIDNNTLFDAIKRCCEWKVGVKVSRKDVEKLEGGFFRSLRRAMENDSKYRGSKDAPTRLDIAAMPFTLNTSNLDE